MNKTQAIGRALLVRALVNGLERRVQEGIDDAASVGLTNAEQKLSDALGFIEQAHAALNEVPAMVAAHFGDSDVTPYSGGSTDDKEEN